MGCKLDPEYPPYRRFLLTTMTYDTVSSQAALPQPAASDSQVVTVVNLSALIAVECMKRYMSIHA